MIDPTIPPAKTKQVGDLLLIWRIAARYPGRIAAAVTALLVSAGAALAVPNSFRAIIDKGYASSEGGMSQWFVQLLAIVSVMAIATAFRFYFVSWLGERVVADLRSAVQANLMRLSPAFFEANRPSEIASRLTADTTVIEQVVGTTASVALRNVLLGTGGVIYLFTLSPKLAGMLLLAIPLIVLPIVFIGRRLRKLSRTSQDRIADVGAMTDEVLGAMKVVQAFGQEKRETQRHAEAVEGVFNTARQRILTRAVMTAIVITIIFGSVTMVLWQGALDVASGRMSGGAIAAFVLTGALVAGAFGALTEVYGDILRGAGAAGRLGELMNRKPTIFAPEKPTPRSEPAQGGVAFSHVTFRYPTRPEVAALSDFSLDVKPGETLAVVGPSGAGKTTLFQLLQRFYDPQDGHIALDGVELPRTDPAWIRARIAVVPQETVIFASSARDNLRYGRWTASDDELWKVAEAANAAEFLRKFPQGLDTFMGEGGARLSGGQRQRLAIARALLRDAPILLLDEATSALDAESERLVQDALNRVMAGRTTIVIAHRLATVRTASRIIVMDKGRIVEEGTHDTLSCAGGLYERLAKLQFDLVAA